MEVIILFFRKKVLTIFGMGSKNRLLYMSKTRAVSLGCEEMRLGKGKFKCMHIRLNCLLNIWNVWCILLRKINQCQWINVSLWTKLHYSERTQTLFVLNPVRMIIFWSRTLPSRKSTFEPVLLFKRAVSKLFFFPPRLNAVKAVMNHPSLSPLPPSTCALHLSISHSFSPASCYSLLLSFLPSSPSP